MVFMSGFLKIKNKKRGEISLQTLQNTGYLSTLYFKLKNDPLCDKQRIVSLESFPLRSFRLLEASFGFRRDSY